MKLLITTFYFIKLIHIMINIQPSLHNSFIIFKKYIYSYIIYIKKKGN